MGKPRYTFEFGENYKIVADLIKEKSWVADEMLVSLLNPLQDEVVLYADRRRLIGEWRHDFIHGDDGNLLYNSPDFEIKVSLMADDRYDFSEHPSNLRVIIDYSSATVIVFVKTSTYKQIFINNNVEYLREIIHEGTYHKF